MLLPPAMAKGLYVVLVLLAGIAFEAGAAGDRTACVVQVLAELRGRSSALVVEVGKLATDPLHLVTDVNRDLMRQFGLVDSSGQMDDATARTIWEVELALSPTPRRADVWTPALSEAELRAQLDAETGRGYAFFDATDLISPELRAAMEHFLPDFWNGLNPLSGIFEYPGMAGHMRDQKAHFENAPSTPDQQRWLKNIEVMEIFERESPVLAQRLGEKALSLLPPEEARGLEMGRSFVLSAQKPRGLPRHADNMYLRVGVSLNNEATWQWDPVTRQVVTAPRNWAVIFSGRLRHPPSWHYGPKGLVGRRDAIFVDIVRKQQ